MVMFHRAHSHPSLYCLHPTVYVKQYQTFFSRVWRVGFLQFGSVARLCVAIYADTRRCVGDDSYSNRSASASLPLLRARG